MLGRALRVLIRGHTSQKTRFHDQRGNAIAISSLRYLPVASFDWVLRVGLDRRRAVPWLSYRAVRDINRALTKDSRVLEFGAGMSTIWFAQRAATVVSIESDPEWHRKLRSLLDARGRTNVDLRLRPEDCARYTDVADLPDASFDFALIDGACRAHCVEPVLAKVRAGGLIYIDNTDNWGQEAESVLLASGRSKGTHHYTDFGPGLAFAFQGLLVRL